MAYPPYDFYVDRDVYVGDSCGYRTGDGIYKQVADDLGLVIGVDMHAARSDVLERPADNAKRALWVDYVLTQHPDLSREDIDAESRDELIARVTKTPAKKTAARPADSSNDTTTTDTGV
jgi:hypothetical protein